VSSGYAAFQKYCAVFCRGISSIGGSGLGHGGVSSGYVGSYTSPQSLYTSGQSNYASGNAVQSTYQSLYGTRTQVGCISFLQYIWYAMDILAFSDTFITIKYHG